MGVRGTARVGAPFTAWAWGELARGGGLLPDPWAVGRVPWSMLLAQGKALRPIGARDERGGLALAWEPGAGNTGPPAPPVPGQLCASVSLPPSPSSAHGAAGIDPLVCAQPSPPHRPVACWGWEWGLGQGQGQLPWDTPNSHITACAWHRGRGSSDQAPVPRGPVPPTGVCAPQARGVHTWYTNTQI